MQEDTLQQSRHIYSNVGIMGNNTRAFTDCFISIMGHNTRAITACFISIMDNNTRAIIACFISIMGNNTRAITACFISIMGNNTRAITACFISIPKPSVNPAPWTSFAIGIIMARISALSMSSNGGSSRLDSPMVPKAQVS